MNYWKELGKKNWIDWIKILVAIDIASSGIGLILGLDMHVFAYLLRVIGLGFLSSIFFGVLYVFVAVLILKRVFPQKLAEEEHIEADRMNEEIVDTTHAVQKSAKKFAQKAAEVTDKVHDKLDHLIDKGEEFIGTKKREAKDEVDKLINE
jgi:uncharacterized membrane protein YhiD involved in acid resistance